MTAHCAVTRCAVVVDRSSAADHFAVADHSVVIQIAEVDRCAGADRDAEAARVVIRVAPNVVLVEAQNVVQLVAQVAARVVTQVVVVVQAGQQAVRCAAPDYFAAVRFQSLVDRANASRHLRACSGAPCGRDGPRFEAGPLVDPLAARRCFCDRLVDPDE